MSTLPDTVATLPPRRGRRRWALRLAVIAAALVVTTVVLVQVFLWTDYPRQIAEAQVERILHVRTTIKSVSIGWLGHTRIEGVELTLPMEREPFLSIDRIDAQHASLPWIAFDQELSRVSVSGVELVARQDVTGRWNVQQLSVPRSDDSTTTAPKRPRNPIASLPAFVARDVRAAVVRKDGKRLDLPVLDAELEKPDAVGATLKATAGDVLTLEGELGQSAALPQTVRAKVTHVPADVAAFFDVATPPSVSADVVWIGRLTSSGLAGSLQVNDLRVEDVRSKGRVDVALDDGRVSVKPIDLGVTIANGAVLDARATAGEITFDQTLLVNALAGSLNGGRFVVNGTFDPATLASDLAAKWEHVTRDTVATTGAGRIRTARLFTGNVKLEVEARGAARLPGGEAVGAMALSGELSGAEAFTATVTLDPFTWTPADAGPPIVSPRLAGSVSFDGTAARMDAHAADDPRIASLSAYAGGDRTTKQWWATVDGAGLRLPELEARKVKGPVDFGIAARGLGTAVQLDQAYVKLEKGSVYAQGSGDLAGSRPVKASVWAWYDKPVTEDEAAQLNSLRLASTIEGTLAPRDLRADVEVYGTELVFARRRVGDVSLQLKGGFGTDEAWVQSQELDAFGGHWSLRGGWMASTGGPPTVVVWIRDLPLDNLGQLANRKDLYGQIDAGSATFRIHSTRLDEIEMTASATGSSLAAGAFRAGTLDVTATLKAGQFELKPTLREQGGTIAARVTGDVKLDSPARATVTLTDWPAPYLVSTTPGAQRFRPRASGTANAEASLRTGEISADLNIGGTIERDDAKLADFRVEGELKQKVINITRLTLDTLDGTLDATAQLNLANYNASVVSATFDRLTPARLAWSNPLMAEVKGRLSGTFAIRPSTIPRPMGPVELELKVRPDAMSFRGVQVGDTDVLAYGDVTSPNQFRIVTSRAAFHVAGGVIEPFARLSSEPERGIAQLVTASFKEVDLAQLARAADDKGKEIIGKVAGRVQLYGQTTNLASLNGDATIEISESDLANFGPIAALYNALSVGTAGSEPRGSGSVSLRVGNNELTIDDASYFNRGVYATAFGTLRGLDKGVNVEVDHAVVVGSLQPLRDVKLPFFGDVNDTLAALQSSVTAIDVSGTLKEPKMEQVALGSLTATIQKVVLGKARAPK